MTATFTNLLNQIDIDHSTRPVTLEETLRRNAKELTDEDFLLLITAFREQAAQWRENQRIQSKARVTAKQITIGGKKVPKGLKVKIKTPVL